MGRFTKRSLTTGGVTLSVVGLLIGFLGAATATPFAIWGAVALGVAGLGLVLYVLAHVVPRGRVLHLDDEGVTLVARGSQRRIPLARLGKAVWTTAEEVLDTDNDTVVTHPDEDWVLLLGVEGEAHVRILGRDLYRPREARAALERRFPRPKPLS